MTKLTRASVAILVAITFSNCVTILSPKKQKFTVNTNNAKATVSIDGEKVGTGSTIETKIVKNASGKQIKVEVPDCKTTYYAVLPNRQNPLSCVTCLFSIPIYFPYIVDMANSKTYLYPNSSDALAGKKKKVKQTADKYIDINEVKFDIKEKDFKYIPIPYENYLNKIDKVESDTKKSKQIVTSNEALKIDNTVFSTQLSKILKKYGYIDTVNQIFKDQANSVELRANVKTLTFYSVYEVPGGAVRIGAGMSYNNFYICKSDIEWNLLNNYGEVLKSVTIRSQSGEFVNMKDLETMMGDMIETSLDQVLTNKNIIPYTSVENKVETKLALTTLAKPTSPITAAADVQQATVIVKTDKGHGSGFAVSNDGYIITNYHVIASENPDKQKELTIILNDGTKHKATVVKYNKVRDVALLKIDQKFEKCFEIPTQKNFTALEEVFAMGAPNSVELGQSVSKGIISSERNTNNVSLIQTNMSINGGNSGGPMFSKEGKLYGVVTSKLYGIGVEGVSFCIPAYKIQDYLSIEFK